MPLRSQLSTAHSTTTAAAAASVPFLEDVCIVYMWVVRKARDHDVPITRMKELNSFISRLSEIALGIYVMHSGYKSSKCRTQGQSVVIGENVLWPKGRSQITLTHKILAFLDRLPRCVDIFYGIELWKKCTFLDHLPTLSCKRSLWTTPYVEYGAHCYESAQCGPPSISLITQDFSLA